MNIRVDCDSAKCLLSWIVIPKASPTTKAKVFMALTVPPPTSSFSEFGWIFNNNHLDSSIYQDDDLMDFSDSSGEYQAQQQPPQVSLVIVNSSSHCLLFREEK